MLPLSPQQFSLFKLKGKQMQGYQNTNTNRSQDKIIHRQEINKDKKYSDLLSSNKDVDSLCFKNQYAHLYQYKTQHLRSAT